MKTIGFEGGGVVYQISVLCTPTDSDEAVAHRTAERLERAVSTLVYGVMQSVEEIVPEMYPPEEGMN